MSGPLFSPWTVTSIGANLPGGLLARGKYRWSGVCPYGLQGGRGLVKLVFALFDVFATGEPAIFIIFCRFEAHCGALLALWLI